MAAAHRVGRGNLACVARRCRTPPTAKPTSCRRCVGCMVRHVRLTLDLVALAFFVVAWLGYAFVLERGPFAERSLNRIMHTLPRPVDASRC